MLVLFHTHTLKIFAMCLCSNLGCCKCESGSEGVFWSSRFSLCCAIKFNDTSACLNRLKCLSFYAAEMERERGPRSKARDVTFLLVLHNLMTPSVRMLILSFHRSHNSTETRSRRREESGKGEPEDDSG